MSALSNDDPNNGDQITLLDVDGPCALFDLTTIKAVNPNITEQNMRELDDWDIFKLFNPEELKRCYKLLEDPQFWMSLPANEPAQRAVSKIREIGGKVVFVTSPWDGCKEWDYTRRLWLKKHFDAKGREDVIITSAKDLVYGELFIDDKLTTVQAWSARWKKNGKQAVLFETNTNFKSDWFPRIIVQDNKWKISEKKEG